MKYLIVLVFLIFVLFWCLTLYQNKFERVYADKDLQRVLFKNFENKGWNVGS